MIGLGVGLLIQPNSYPPRRVEPFDTWAADNGCYPPDRPWSIAKWMRMLGGMMELAPEVQARCLYCLVPDVPFSHERTLERFERFHDFVGDAGFPPAFAIQDGATVDSVPWDHFDVAFLAGSTEWKVGDEAHQMAEYAACAGKRAHMGRVNSWKRLDWASLIGCHSSDGTFMRHGPPAEMLGRIDAWLRRNQPRLAQVARNA